MLKSICISSSNHTDDFLLTSACRNLYDDYKQFKLNAFIIEQISQPFCF